VKLDQPLAEKLLTLAPKMTESTTQSLLLGEGRSNYC
jgi:hypothetical protein